jgi:hypothetical protein
MCGEGVRSAPPVVPSASSPEQLIPRFAPEVEREWTELYKLSGGTFRVKSFITKSHRPGTVRPYPYNYVVMWTAVLHPRRLFLANKDPFQPGFTYPTLEVDAVVVPSLSRGAPPIGVFPVGGGDITDGTDVDKAEALLRRLFREAREIIQLAALRALGRGAVA